VTSLSWGISEASRISRAINSRQPVNIIEEDYHCSAINRKRKLFDWHFSQNGNCANNLKIVKRIIIFTSKERENKTTKKYIKEFNFQPNWVQTKIEIHTNRHTQHKRHHEAHIDKVSFGTGNYSS
jgi:dolichyl-phosphate-mannose--protein O-mannosyl transferase